MDYVKFFNDNDLHLLSSIFSKCDNTDRILKLVKTGLGITISEGLSTDEILKLKEFEKENYDFLIRFLISNVNTDENNHRKKLDWFILGFAFLYLPAITFIPLSETGYRVADTVLGVVIGMLIGSVMGYWYDGVAKRKE